MSKNITIQEGGIGKQLTANKLKTNLVGGGTCLWVPEDETRLGTKYISENGTYRASDEGLYGYSEVTVSGIGTATGTGSDGEDHSYSEDGYGGVIDALLPSSISVVTPPTVTTYADGATINFSGMVVKGYLKSGALWTDSSHPNGIIPISELMFPVTTASKDESYSDEWSDGRGLNARLITITQHWDIDYRGQDIARYVDSNPVGTIAFGEHSGEAALLGRPDDISQFYATIFDGVIWTKKIAGAGGAGGVWVYDPSKETYKYSAVIGIGILATDEWNIGNANFPGNYINSSIPVSTENPREGGELSPVASYQTIPVQYLRTDGKTLESSFDITVT